MAPVFLVMAGGALGAAARYGVGRMAPTGGWPWATLGVNLLGGFAMGLLAAAAARGAAGESARLLLGVGLLGGFTTFSAFGLETVTMLDAGAGGRALGYAVASVLGVVGAVIAGRMIGRAL